MGILILSQPKNRLKKLNRFSRYQKIRKYSKLKNFLFVLRSTTRRRWQIWRWRFNRKSYQSWKALRYTRRYNLNSLVKLRHQTNFRLQRMIKNYLQWRFNNRSINLAKTQQSYLVQNRLQNYSQMGYSRLINDHIGSIGINFYQWRHMTKWYKNRLYANHRVVRNPLVAKNDVLIFPNRIKKPINTMLAFETNNLINGLIQYNLNNLVLLAKYDPKQQRYLNTNLL